jgi:HSP20 family molecular chaperone IbpA
MLDVNDQAYPRYNIEVEENSDGSVFTVSVALAGFSKDEISVTREKGTGKASGLDLIKISAEKEKTEEQSSRKFLVKNIALRNASRVIPVARSTEVTKVEYVDGILRITIVDTIPEEDKPVSFEIN